jgi:hypothetical protein
MAFILMSKLLLAGDFGFFAPRYHRSMALTSSRATRTDAAILDIAQHGWHEAVSTGGPR